MIYFANKARKLAESNPIMENIPISLSLSLSLSVGKGFFPSLFRLGFISHYLSLSVSFC